MEFNNRIITRVKEYSEADNAEICIGWKILEVNDEVVSNDSAIHEAMEAVSDKQHDLSILFEILTYQKGEIVECRDCEDDEWQTGTVSIPGTKPDVDVKGLGDISWRMVRRIPPTFSEKYLTKCWNPKATSQN